MNLVFVSLTVKRIWEQTAQKVKYMPDNQLLLPIPTTVTDFVILTPPLHDLLQLLQEPQLAQDAAIGPGYQIETLPQRNPGIVFLAQDFKVSQTESVRFDSRSRSFNKLRSLGQTSAGYGLAGGEHFFVY